MKWYHGMINNVEQPWQILLHRQIWVWEVSCVFNSRVSRQNDGHLLWAASWHGLSYVSIAITNILYADAVSLQAGLPAFHTDRHWQRRLYQCQASIISSMRMTWNAFCCRYFWGRICSIPTQEFHACYDDNAGDISKYDFLFGRSSRSLVPLPSS